MSALVPEQGLLRSWVELYGPQSEAPDEAHLGTAIATVSALIGWKAHIRWGENSEPITLNIILEGASASARKTTTAGSAASLARSLPKRADETPTLAVESISHTSGRGLLELVAANDDEQAETWEDDPPPGHLFIWDEFGSILGRPEDMKGSGWEGGIRSTVMLLTNGRHGGVQTGAAKRPGGRCAVSILATMTRYELEQRVTSGLLSDGFMGRFLLIPHNGRARLLPEPPAWTPLMLKQRASIQEWLTKLATSTVDLGNAFTMQTPEARQCRAEWYESWVLRLEAGATNGDAEMGGAVLSAFARLQTLAMKMAVIAAVCEWDGKSNLKDVRIERHQMEYAQRLAELALTEIVDLGEKGGATRKDEYGEKVLGYLGRYPKPVMKHILMKNVRHCGLDWGTRWGIIKGLHPEVLTVEAIDGAGYLVYPWGQAELNRRQTGDHVDA